MQLKEATNEWLRMLLKHLELNLFQMLDQLNAESTAGDYGLVALRALRLTLSDSGIPTEQLKGLFGVVALEEPGMFRAQEWNAQLNARRFALIDQQIQGTLSDSEKLELSALTHVMRMTIDSEMNLPMEGARKLHRMLIDPGSTGAQSDR